MNSRRAKIHLWLVFIALVIVLTCDGLAKASKRTELFVGAATTDITPKSPVVLGGHLEMRISKGVRNSLTATAVALESLRNVEVLDQAIMVSCDLIAIPDEILDLVRQGLKERLLDFDAKKLFISATHTHTGPVLEEGLYKIPKKGIVQPKEYVRLLTEKLID
jgi:hypothetical protein